MTAFETLRIVETLSALLLNKTIQIIFSKDIEGTNQHEKGLIKYSIFSENVQI